MQDTNATNATNPFAPFPYNSTLFENPQLCTTSTCPISWAASKYLPSLPGNAFYAGGFGLFLVVQIFLGVRYRTWGFMAGMISGCILEVVGYGGRILIYMSQFNGGGFLIHITTLTIAPAFFAASIYLCLSRIVIAYGQHLSRFKPRTYTLFFIICDVISLFLQAAGGVTTSMSNGHNNVSNIAINVMVAGLSFQVVSLAVFGVACAEFGLRVRRARKEDLNPSFAHVTGTVRFRAFLWVLALSTLAIFIRSVFRCVELREGFQGPLANNEVTFMVLEGAMIACTVLLLTVWHPGSAFQNTWNNAGWHLRRPKKSTDVQELDAKVLS